MLIYLSMLEDPEERDKFQILYQTYKKLMFYVANRILGDTRDTEDVVHQAFVKILEHMDKISDPNCPQTRHFIVTVVERKAIDLYRSRSNHPQVTLEEPVCPGQLAGPEEGCGGDLARAILQLPARYRQVLLLRYDSGYSEREIAQMLSMTPANVKKTIQRAKHKLAELMEGEVDVR